MTEAKGLLFLCVANSARSQMAEGLARNLDLLETEIMSAGSEPTQPNPYAIKVMSEIGIDIGAHTSKSIDEVPRDQVGTVITLCAEEVCPAYLGQVQRLHWPFPDPAAAEGSEEEILTSFRRVRDDIQQQLKQYFHRSGQI